MCVSVPTHMLACMSKCVCWWLSAQWPVCWWITSISPAYGPLWPLQPPSMALAHPLCRDTEHTGCKAGHLFHHIHSHSGVMGSKDNFLKFWGAKSMATSSEGIYQGRNLGIVGTNCGSHLEFLGISILHAQVETNLWCFTRSYLGS